MVDECWWIKQTVIYVNLIYNPSFSLRVQRPAFMNKCRLYMTLSLGPSTTDIIISILMACYQATKRVRMKRSRTSDHKLAILGDATPLFHLQFDLILAFILLEQFRTIVVQLKQCQPKNLWLQGHGITRRPSSSCREIRLRSCTRFWASSVKPASTPMNFRLGCCERDDFVVVFLLTYFWLWNTKKILVALGRTFESWIMLNLVFSTQKRSWIDVPRPTIFSRDAGGAGRSRTPPAARWSCEDPAGSKSAFFSQKGGGETLGQICQESSQAPEIWDVW